MQNFSGLLILLVVAVVLLGIIGLIVNGRQAAPKFRAKALMTPTELAFYRLLREAALPLNVAPQVAMGAIVRTVSGLDRSESQGARNKFSQKMIDFVLFDDDGVIKLLVEHDDRTHKADKDAGRDSITGSAGYTTLRMRGAETRSVDAIREAIAARLAAIDVPLVGDAKALPRRRKGQTVAAAAE